METLKQHYMVKMKKGECHPVFDVKYLAENIASLVEAIVTSAEYLLVVFFFTNLFINIYARYSMHFVPTLLINGFSSEIFSIFGASNTVLNNLIAMVATVVAYIISYQYFEYVKYNLHPKKKRTKKENSSLDEFSLVEGPLEFWNTLGEIALEWEPILKVVYKEQEEPVDIKVI